MIYRKRYRKNNTDFLTSIILLAALYYIINNRKYLMWLILAIPLIIGIAFLKNIVPKWYRKKKYLNSSLYIIDKMKGTDFEEYLQTQFENKGYSVKHTGKSGDYGIDLVLKKDNMKIAVQAKRYNNKIGVAAIQQVISGREFYKCNSSMVITNSFYTKNAVEMAKRCNVILWDRNTIEKEFKRIGR